MLFYYTELAFLKDLRSLKEYNNTISCVYSSFLIFIIFCKVKHIPLHGYSKKIFSPYATNDLLVTTTSPFLPHIP